MHGQAAKRHEAEHARTNLGTTRSRWTGSALLIGTIIGTGFILAAWKQASIKEAEAAAASQPEPIEMVSAAVATSREHRQTATSIGTVLALRSVELRNELSGTVRHVRLTPGQIVDAGTVLVGLDVSVEQAELKALEAQAALTETVLGRIQRLYDERAEAQTALDRARAERDVALAQIARTKAIIARKTIRAPFRARVGIADVHPGQYLHEGTVLTTLQSVDDAVHVDFAVAQHVAAGLRRGEVVQVFAGGVRPRSPRGSSPSTRASTRRRVTRWCARVSRAERPLHRPARRSASSSLWSRPQRGRDSGECASPGACWRSRVRAGSRRSGETARERETGAERCGAGR